MKEARSLSESGLTVNLIRRSTSGNAGYENVDGVNIYTVPAIEDGKALRVALRVPEVKRVLSFSARTLLFCFAYISTWGGYSISQAKIVRPAYSRIARLKSRFTRMLARRLHLLLRYHLYVCEYLPKGLELGSSAWIHAHDLYMLRTAVSLKRLTGAQCIYDAHELESDRRVDTHPMLRKLIVREEQKMARYTDGVITVGPMIAEIMAKNLDIPTPTIILNAPPMAEFTDDKSRPLGLRARLDLSEDVPLVLFVGKIFDHDRQDHQSRLLAEAVSDLEGVHLVFLGPMGELAQEQFTQMKNKLAGGTRLHRLDPVSVDELVPTISDATVGASMMPPHTLNTDLAFPNKLCEYVLSGVTVLSFNNRQLREIVEPLGRGVFIENITREDVRGGVQNAIALDAQRRTTGERKSGPLQSDILEYSWAPQAVKLRALYRELFQGRLGKTP